MAARFHSLTSETWDVQDPLHIGRARRRAKRLALKMGFNGIDSERVALSASELCSNLIRHAGGGTFTVRWLQRQGKVGVEQGIELEAHDQGPGIPDIEAALQDGFSTAGSLGSGLPAVQRLMDELEIQSVVGGGTRVSARLWLP